MYMKMVFTTTVLCAVFLSFGSAQETYQQDCPSVDTFEELDMNKLVEGSPWYELKMVKLTGYTAVRPRCSMTSFGTDLSVTTQFEAPNKTAYTLKGHLKKLDRKGSFNITYDNIVTSGELPYNVLLAEYDDFVLIFGCTQGRDDSQVNGWLLSRSPVLSRKAEEKFAEKLESIGFYFPGLFYYDVDRSGCKTEAAAKTPVVSFATPEKQTPEIPFPPPAPSTMIQGSSIQLMYYVSQDQPSQGESSADIRLLMAAQWGMLVALLLLGLFVVMSALAVYRMLLPFLRARQHDETRTLVFAPNDSKEKKNGHYNDGLKVDV